MRDRKRYNWSITKDRENMEKDRYYFSRRIDIGIEKDRYSWSLWISVEKEKDSFGDAK